MKKENYQQELDEGMAATLAENGFHIMLSKQEVRNIVVTILFCYQKPPKHIYWSN